MKKHAEFVHLHIHTQYSLLDGAIRLSELFQKAVEYKMPALAITDHGNMIGAIHFYKKAMKSGIKPIIGCEVYVAPGSRLEKPVGDEESAYHLILLARNKAGYQNLMWLVSEGYLNGFYRKPRIDKEVLREHAEGLIGLSACMHGEIPSHLLHGQRDKAARAAEEYADILGRGNFYLEIQDNGLEEQKIVNDEMIRLGRELSIPLVATNDCHYPRREDAAAHEVLLCIQTGKTLMEEDRFRFSTDQLYLKSPEEMAHAFSHVPEAIRNTVEIAERCNLELEFNKVHLPAYDVPEGVSLEVFLRDKAEQGLLDRMNKGKVPRSREDIYRARLAEELTIIHAMGFPGYFLIVWDFVQWAKAQGIPVGPGRGSGAGSLVAYALGITDIDPIPYGLLFERFMNPERVSMPDFDIDFCMERRGEVIDYVTKRYSMDKGYGNEAVGQIMAIGSLQARGVIRDVARVMGIPYAEADVMAKLVPNELGIKLEDAIRREKKFTEMAEKDPQIRKLLDIAMALEGLYRNASTHAAGVVIGDRSLREWTPLYRSDEAEIVTQYDKKIVEEVGLVKFDFLGLRTLTVIDKAVKIIHRQSRAGANLQDGPSGGNAPLNMADIPLDDPAVFELLSRGDAMGIFQLESSGMRDLLVKIKPRNFEDIIALVALYRPGPMGSGMVDEFVMCKHGKKEMEVILPELEPVLKETYGVIVYQEQVMEIAKVLAGYSLGNADLLRRAMGKKIPEEMDRHKAIFLHGDEKLGIPGAIKRGVDPRKAEKVFDRMAYFAGYGFNKSHSAAYALIAYQTAYLKAHYPVAFIAALISSDMDNTDKVVQYISECRERGIEVLPPDLNESNMDFTVVGNKIRFGLAAVKNVGGSAIEEILKARETGVPFKSIFDFCERADLKKVNKRVIEGLIKCGAFDSTGAKRSQLMEVFERAMEMNHKAQRDRELGQGSLFGIGGNEHSYETEVSLPEIEEWHENELLRHEKESLGFYISGHPLARCTGEIRKFTNSDTARIRELGENAEVSLCGVISACKKKVTRRGDKMAVLTLEDLQGVTEVLVFPKVYEKTQDILESDLPVLIKGRIKKDEKGVSIISEEVTLLKDIRKREAKRVDIRLSSTGLNDEHLSRIRDVLMQHKGGCDVYLHIVVPNHSEAVISVGNDIRVSPSDRMIMDIESIAGNRAVTVS
ncbi:MAG: DNA polymerase III subunit alpha [bacterium]